LEKDDLELLRDALTRVDAATTKAATAAQSIGARIQSLLDQAAANAGNGAVVADLLSKASAEASSLEGLATSLTAMGSDPANPVPVEPPVVPAV
jgi:hypothetical protein